MPESEEQQSSAQKSPEQLRKGLRNLALAERIAIGKPKVDGWENYKEIRSNPEQRFVIAPTHRSDAELPLVLGAFVEEEDLKLTVLTHDANLYDQEGSVLELPDKVVGEENFVTVGVKRDPEQSTEARARDQYMLSALEMKVIAERMQTEGMTPIIAAHRPVYHSPLPAKPGMADVMVAHLSGSRTILPVAVDWMGKDPIGNSHEMKEIAKNFIPFNRRKIGIHIAPAIHLPEIPQDHLSYAMDGLSGESRHKLTKEQQVVSLQTLGILREQSGLVMQALADTLPETDRGIWGTKASDLNANQIKDAEASSA